MKKSLLLLLAVLCAHLALAQPAYTIDNTTVDSKPRVGSSYIGMVEIGYLSGKAKRNDWFNQPYIYASPTVQVFNGYRLNQYFALGGTTGLDYYENLLIVPIALGIRGSLFSSRVSPVYSVDAGYGAAFLNPQSKDYSSHGGWTINPAIGFKVKTGNETAFTFSAGFKTQKARVEYQNFGWGNSKTVQMITYNRFVLRLGFLF